MTADLFGVAGKVVLITGGTSGIGRMMAAGFAAAGAQVHIVGRRPDEVEKVADELRASGACAALPGDVGTEDGCRRIAAEMGDRAATLDVLINNAGTSSRAPLADFGHDEWGQVLAVNLEGPFHLTRLLLPQLREAAQADGPARVINVGSSSGVSVPVPEVYAYGASKAGLHHLTRHLARQLAPDVTVNALAPGPFPSRLTAGDIERHGEWIASHTPLGRLGSWEDICGVAMFLASRAGAFLTGAVIPVDGGITTTV